MKTLHQPLLIERRTGTITEILGEEIEVSFDFPEGPLKQIYRLSGLKGDKRPREGDQVEARLSLVVTGRPEPDDTPLESSLPSFADIPSPKEVVI